MNKLNQKEAKALASVIIDDVNTEIDQYNEFLKSSKPYLKAAEEVRASREYKATAKKIETLRAEMLKGRFSEFAANKSLYSSLGSYLHHCMDAYLAKKFPQKVQYRDSYYVSRETKVEALVLTRNAVTPFPYESLDELTESIKQELFDRA